MKDFFVYFFGKGDTVEFTNFTLAHFLPILLAVAVIFAIRHFREQIRSCPKEANFRYVLAFMLIIAEMSYFWRLVGVPSLEPNPVDHLPITVCGWAVIFCSYMLAGKCQSLFDISYFWLFSGTIFALITPTVITYTGPTRYRYYQFWAEHTLGYVAVFYMIFVHGMRPTWKSMAKSYVALAALGVIAFAANRLSVPGKARGYAFYFGYPTPQFPAAAGGDGGCGEPDVLPVLPAMVAQGPEGEENGSGTVRKKTAPVGRCFWFTGKGMDLLLLCLAARGMMHLKMDQKRQQRPQDDHGAQDQQLFKVPDQHSLQNLGSHFEFQADRQTVGQLEFYVAGDVLDQTFRILPKGADGGNGNDGNSHQFTDGDEARLFAML